MQVCEKEQLLESGAATRFRVAVKLSHKVQSSSSDSVLKCAQKDVSSNG